MKLVLMSDTHGLHKRLPEIPDGDVLIHAGDCTGTGDFNEFYEFCQWLSWLPHKHKLLVAGNHDWCLARSPGHCYGAMAQAPGLVCLNDSSVVIDGLTFWGSPWQPAYYNWAFNLPRGPALKEHWDLIPAHTDVLITHTPAYGWLDENLRGERIGCMDLLDAVERTRPRLHVAGHVHEARGHIAFEGTLRVNACVCNREYKPVNAPWEVSL